VIHMYILHLLRRSFLSCSQMIRVRVVSSKLRLSQSIKAATKNYPSSQFIIKRMASNDSTAKPDEEWKAPPRLEDCYPHLAGNRFASTNSDTAGARTQKALPAGSAEFQLYSLATPNGQKVSIACEEFDIKYDAHRIDISKGDQFTSGFVEVNPNSKIPAMKHGDVRIFESGAILLYLANKYQKFFPTDPAERAEAYSWLMFQMSGQGPMFGNFGHFFRVSTMLQYKTTQSLTF